MSNKQWNVESGYQLSICSRIEENHGKTLIELTQLTNYQSSLHSPVTNRTENTISNSYCWVRVCCGHHVTATEPLLSNGCLCWLHNSGFQYTCFKLLLMNYMPDSFQALQTYWITHMDNEHLREGRDVCITRHFRRDHTFHLWTQWMRCLWLRSRGNFTAPSSAETQKEKAFESSCRVSVSFVRF
jgi:hypothetical protein